MRSTLTLLVAPAGWGKTIPLVLDDFHHIQAQPIYDALTFLIEHLPPQVHLVLASRSDPLLPLARPRAQGALTEVRAADLRFTAEESAAFLVEVMGLPLSAEQVAALQTRTEGWIAGLQLAVLSLQGREDAAGFIAAFTGSHRYVVDHLTEREVLRLLVDGASNREIADHLVLSVNTVKKHVFNICSKLNVQGRTHAIAKVRILNILEY